MVQTGGKGRAFQRIISLMPPHRVYIETHLGGGAVLRRKRPAERSFGVDLDARVVERWRDHPLPGLEVVHGCALDFLRRFAFAGQELVYCDPPYWPDARRRERCYRHDYTREQHRELLDLTSILPCRVMLSGYRNPLYDELLAGWERHDIVNQTQAGPVDESVWTNFEAGHHLHDYSYVGDDFRERERIRRGRRTQVERLRRASPVERAAMLSDIAEAFPDDVIAIAERIR
jgi:DNA adenine methylase